MEAYHIIDGDYDDSNLSGIQEYLEIGGDPNFEIYHGVTVFIEAVSCLRDNINVVRELISAGADVNRSTLSEATPLIIAVHNRKPSVVKELLRCGASVNAKDAFGQTALHHAVRKIYNTCITYVALQRWRIDPDTEIISELLNHEDINCNQGDFVGETPLMYTVRDGRFTITKLLLKHFVNPNVGNLLSLTPLHVAFSRPPTNVEIELLLGGASIYSVDEIGRTPMDVLIEKGLYVRDDFRLYIISKLVALNYTIKRNLKRKINLVHRLSPIFNQCCREADRMRGDYIYENITMHDFLRGCFSEPEPSELVQKIHKPIVERLVRDIYPEYCSDILVGIPKSNLCEILRLFAEKYRRMRDLTFLLSQPIINEAITKHLRDDEIYGLIRALFGEAISREM